MRSINVDGLKASFESKGRGKTILFVHGSAGDHSVWMHQLDYFGEMYQAMAIDLMGHGKSEISIPTSQISIKEYTSFVNSFLEALNITKATLIGQSLGGAVCIQFCLDFPQKVECLGLINTGAKLGVNPQLLSMLREDFHKALQKGLGDILGQEREGTAQTRSEREVMKTMLRTNPEIGLADFEACNNFDSREKLSRIHKPTLIIGGSEDVLTPPWFQRYLHEKIEDSNLTIIDGAGHLSMIERPEEFNVVLLKFLRRHL